MEPSLISKSTTSKSLFETSLTEDGVLLLVFIVKCGAIRGFVLWFLYKWLFGLLQNTLPFLLQKDDNEGFGPTADA